MINSNVPIYKVKKHDDEFEEKADAVDLYRRVYYNFRNVSIQYPLQSLMRDGKDLNNFGVYVLDDEASNNEVI